ncbi:MAG: hypothetical protein HZA35_01170 [Parcubacteria group bacterium]|nr:hypothetical protein [Parcubacteria group bacterium]
MKALNQRKLDLDRKFKGVLETPAGFDLFIAIHDFIEHIEHDAVLSKGISNRSRVNQELDIITKYGYLRKIYQGLEDINIKSNTDLGHERYMTIRELTKIQKKDVSDSNSFWKKREVSRRLTGIVYERLSAYLSEPVNPVRSSRGAFNPAFTRNKPHSSTRQAAGRSASNGVKTKNK